MSTSFSEERGGQRSDSVIALSPDGHAKLAKTLERPISPSAFSDLNYDEGENSSSTLNNGKKLLSIHQSRPRGCLSRFWIKNKGLVYVAASQIFNCLMNVTITVLEVEGNNGKGFHPLQVRLMPW
jgi:hypothetical protein